ncbi:MAG: hypothetical protein RKE49_05850 [Oceanicaulis sp.]
MIEPGLKAEERDRLAAAGANPALVNAVAAEAATMRWLFLNRGWDVFILPALGAAGAIFASIALDLPGGAADMLQVFAPILFGLVLLLPWLEMRAMRRHEPVRWAARRLAILAVTAQPEWGEEGDARWRDLQRLVAAGAGYDTPRAALRQIARVLERPAPKTAAGGQGLNGALAMNRLNLEVWSTVALVIALCALAMTAVLKFS